MFSWLQLINIHEIWAVKLTLLQEQELRAEVKYLREPNYCIRIWFLDREKWGKGTQLNQRRRGKRHWSWLPNTSSVLIFFPLWWLRIKEEGEKHGLCTPKISFLSLYSSSTPGKKITEEKRDVIRGHMTKRVEWRTLNKESSNVFPIHSSH